MTYTNTFLKDMTFVADKNIIVINIFGLFMNFPPTRKDHTQSNIVLTRIECVLHHDRSGCIMPIKVTIWFILTEKDPMK
jgi:hypothetical protein